MKTDILKTGLCRSQPARLVCLAITMIALSGCSLMQSAGPKTQLASMQNQRTANAEFALFSLKEIDVLAKLDNRRLSKQIGAVLRNQAAADDRYDIRKLTISFSSEYISLSALVYVLDKNNSSISTELSGDILLNFNARSLEWLPRFNQIHISSQDFTFENVDYTEATPEPAYLITRVDQNEARRSFAAYEKEFINMTSSFSIIDAKPDIALIKIKRTFLSEVLEASLGELSMDTVFDKSSLTTGKFSARLQAFNTEDIMCEQLNAQALSSCQIEEGFGDSVCDSIKDSMKSLEPGLPLAMVSTQTHSSGQLVVNFSNIRMEGDLERLKLDVTVKPDVQLAGELNFSPGNVQRTLAGDDAEFFRGQFELEIQPLPTTIQLAPASIIFDDGIYSAEASLTTGNLRYLIEK